MNIISILFASAKLILILFCKLDFDISAIIDCRKHRKMSFNPMIRLHNHLLDLIIDGNSYFTSHLLYRKECVCNNI